MIVSKIPETDIFLVSKSRTAYLGKYERPRESSRVSESESDRMVNSAVGSRSSSDEDDLHTLPTCQRIEG